MLNSQAYSITKLDRLPEKTVLDKIRAIFQNCIVNLAILRRFSRKTHIPQTKSHANRPKTSPLTWPASICGSQTATFMAHGSPAPIILYPKRFQNDLFARYEHGGHSALLELTISLRFSDVTATTVSLIVT
jgi:hypothetical protein